MSGEAGGCVARCLCWRYASQRWRLHADGVAPLGPKGRRHVGDGRWCRRKAVWCTGTWPESAQAKERHLPWLDRAAGRDAVDRDAYVRHLRDWIQSSA